MKRWLIVASLIACLWISLPLVGLATQGANDCSTLLDSFTGGSNENPITTNWTVDAFPTQEPNNIQRIANDGLRPSSADVWGGAWYDVDTNIGPDTEVCGTIPSIVGLLGIELFARIQSPGGSGTADGYLLFVFENSSEARLQRLDNDSTYTTLATATSITWGAGDKAKIEVTGTGATVTLKAYRKPSGGSWSEILSTTDTSASRITGAGAVGVSMNGSTTVTYVDDFSANTISSVTLRRPIAPIILNSIIAPFQSVWNWMRPVEAYAR